MKKIVECVPNFSEGRDQNIIDAISDAISNTPGCTLLDVDPGRSTNRTVYTFVGDPESVINGAFNSAKVAKELIDMTKHSGEHPRMGAMDVCPFVPVANVTMEECVEIAKKFGKRAGEELGIPMFLYEEASERDYRKKLPDIRKGEYEALKERIAKPEWKPDFGPAEFVPNWGATATGARFFLIAYNINIVGTYNQAHRIALNLREAGRGDNKPGRLKETKGLGWFVEDYNMSQISMNLNNYKVTPPHIAYEEAKKDAKKLNIGAAGSEIVGLIPIEAMLMAADYYIEKENLFVLEEDQKIKLVIDRLGLRSVTDFDPKKRIIEYMIKEEKKEPLADMSTRDFINSIKARTTAPGGGSASAAIAAVGSALGTMVAHLTYGWRKFEHLDDQLRKVIPTLYNVTDKLIPMIDADTNAFNDFMKAIRMPKSTEEQKKERNAAMQKGLKKAIEVPLTTMRYGDSAWDTMIEVAKIGNINSSSDVAIGARALELGIWGAYKNVMINMPQIDDEDYKTKTIDEAEKIKDRAKEKSEEILKIIEDREK